ncbi:MAG: rimM [Rhodospirillales bacterium]|nr:rimM [Rhodospirillales bacterium]
MTAQRILVGEIGRPHGVRGLVKLRVFLTDPADISGLGTLTDASGVQRITLTVKAEGLAQIDGVADRDAAARLTGTRLYVERAQLPATEEEEFYLSDLVGLSAVTESGEPLGSVRSVEEHGAGAYLVVGEGRGEQLIPFTRAAVPVVDLDARRLVVIPPAEIIVPPQDDEAAA